MDPNMHMTTGSGMDMNTGMDMGDMDMGMHSGEKAGSQASSSNDCSSSLVGNLATGEYNITGRKLSDKTSSLQKRRQKSNKRTAQLSSEELEEREKKRRLYMKNYRAKQSKEATQARLQHLRQSAAERRDTESEQARWARLQQMRQHAAETRDSESELAKEAHLHQMRQHATETRDSESELAKEAHLHQMRQHATETRDSESELAKEARLQQMRQHAAETRDSESKLAKEARLQQYFYAGDTVTVLFKGWATKDTGSLIGSMIAIMVIAALYEVLKFFREKIHFSTHKQMHEAQISRSACSAMMMKAHIIQTLLHAVQMFVSFSLMLVFMTYNAWLCISVILGGTIGYFLCGWRRHTMAHELDDCH